MMGRRGEVPGIRNGGKEYNQREWRMEKEKGSNKGRRGREGEGWDKREEETVGGIMCVDV